MASKYRIHTRGDDGWKLAKTINLLDPESFAPTQEEVNLINLSRQYGGIITMGDTMIEPVEK